MKEKFFVLIHGGSNSEPSLLAYQTYVPLPFEPFQHLLRVKEKLWNWNISAFHLDVCCPTRLRHFCPSEPVSSIAHSLSLLRRRWRHIWDGKWTKTRTAAFMKTVSVYTILINTIYLSHNTQEVEGTFFRKHEVEVKSFG